MFVPTVALFLLVSIALLAGGAGLKSTLSSLMNVISAKLGWLYLGIYIINFIFFMYIALSHFGKIKLGKKGDRPLYSNFQWGSMVFATAIDASILMLSMLIHCATSSNLCLGRRRCQHRTTKMRTCWDSLTGVQWRGWCLHQPPWLLPMWCMSKMFG